MFFFFFFSLNRERLSQEIRRSALSPTPNGVTIERSSYSSSRRSTSPTRRPSSPTHRPSSPTRRTMSPERPRSPERSILKSSSKSREPPFDHNGKLEDSYRGVGVGERNGKHNGVIAKDTVVAMDTRVPKLWLNGVVSCKMWYDTCMPKHEGTGGS